MSFYTDDSNDVTGSHARLLAERNAMSMEITRLQMALGPFASVYEAWLEAKGDQWCEQHGAYPIHRLLFGDVMFAMPTLEHCRRAKAAAEGEDPDQ